MVVGWARGSRAPLPTPALLHAAEGEERQVLPGQNPSEVSERSPGASGVSGWRRRNRPLTHPMRALGGTTTSGNSWPLTQKVEQASSHDLEEQVSTCTGYVCSQQVASTARDGGRDFIRGPSAMAACKTLSRSHPTDRSTQHLRKKNRMILVSSH